METKVCKKCGVEKDLTLFHFTDKAKVYRRWSCYSCESERGIKYKSLNRDKWRAHNKEYRENNKEKTALRQSVYYKNNISAISARGKVYSKLWREKNSDRINKNRKIYERSDRSKDLKRKRRANNIEKYRDYSRASYERNKDKKLSSSKKYAIKNKEKIKLIKKEYRKNNKEKIKENLKIYIKNNKEKVNKRSLEYKLKRRNSDPIFKMTCNLRKRTWEAFRVKAYIKGGTTEQLLGAEFVVVKNYIESKFEKWMNWDNYGEWVIDHIAPLASAKNEDELKKLCHHTNLQPLLKAHNASKGCRLDYIIPT